ncbi:hypothetical protein PB01_03800 [Psychrobacillus glaciei]|uniref:Uncharacterized protein n=1 Tax=Psychrobacillus glaciei TaxID=2283160 RepID=A0A5J6SJB5_9BACI|nr:hypothetical protein [Psychrobacillus glaciei]QFF98010.1 hypothetical protein PB01_03800 [Psychrobacillus glaciei]
MKKRRRLKLTLLIALIIIIGAGSYILYELKFKTYDVADDEVTEIVADPYTVELPDGSKITIDEKGNVVEEKSSFSKTQTADNTTTNGTTNSSTNEGQSSVGQTQTSGNTITSGSTTSNNSTTKPTVGSIKEKYGPAFVGLEAQADSKINALVGRAKSEYMDKQANGESINFGYFYNKYMAAAKGLEANTDKVFDGVLGAVEKDLTKNGFDKSYAQSFKKEYEASKKARKDSILSKALGK